MSIVRWGNSGRTSPISGNLLSKPRAQQDRPLSLLGKRAILLSALFFGFCAPAFSATMQQLAHSCYTDTIDAVTDDGAIVKTTEGHVYEVNEGDQVLSMLWLVGDDVKVCSTLYRYNGKKITLWTLRDDEDKVDAERLK